MTTSFEVMDFLDHLIVAYNESKPLEGASKILQKVLETNLPKLYPQIVSSKTILEVDDKQVLDLYELFVEILNNHWQKCTEMFKVDGDETLVNDDLTFLKLFELLKGTTEVVQEPLKADKEDAEDKKEKKTKKPKVDVEIKRKDTL